MLEGLCSFVLITTTFLSACVETLVFKTASYSDSQQAQVFEAQEDFALAGHVIETVITDEFDCGVRCIRNRKCQSYNCQTVGNHGNKTCHLSYHTRHSRPKDLKSTQGFTYYGKEKRGSHSSNPGRSCEDIRDSEHPPLSGEYWIDPQNNGNPLKVYCDMTTEGGGWLLIANFIRNSNDNPQWTAETSYRRISNYRNNRTGIFTSAMKELRSHLHYTQLRFRCRKPNGRTFHVITAANSTGEAVVQYFSGQMNTRPEACGSFLRMKDDNSLLSDKCENWGGGVRGDSKWGILGGNKEYLVYDHAAFSIEVSLRIGLWE